MFLYIYNSANITINSQLFRSPAVTPPRAADRGLGTPALENPTALTLSNVFMMRQRVSWMCVCCRGETMETTVFYKADYNMDV